MALVFAVPASAVDPGGKIEVHTSDAGVKYVTGGVGKSETAAMERRFGDWSFKLVNVRKGGAAAYVAGVGVSISNNAGDQQLQATTKGPWLMADLPVGSYALTANFDGQSQTRNFDVSKGGHERLVLAWQTESDPPNREPSGETSLKETVTVGGDGNVEKQSGEEHPGDESGSSDQEHPGKKKAGDDKSGASDSEHPGRKSGDQSANKEHPGEKTGEGKSGSEHPGEGSEHPGK